MRLFLFLLFPLCCISLSPTLSACGYRLLGDHYRIAFFNPYILGDAYAPFYYSSDRLNKDYSVEHSDNHRTNAAEWARYLGDGATTEETFNLIYATTHAQWRDAAADKPVESFQTPTGKLMLSRPAAVAYFLWAKEYEELDFPPFPHRSGKTDEAITAWRTRHQRLLRAAGAAYADGTGDRFLDRRWAYQNLILARYAGESSRVLRFYRKHFAGRTDILARWAGFYAAYARPAAESTVAFAGAFTTLPEKAVAVFNQLPKHFDPEDYDHVVRSDRQSADLYALLGVKTPGGALPILENIYELDPRHPLLPLLVVREVNKLEDWLMTRELTENGPAVQTWPDPEYIYRRGWYAPYQAKRDSLRAAQYRTDLSRMRNLRIFLAEIDDWAGGRNLLQLLRANLALLAEDYPAALSLTRNLTPKSYLEDRQLRIIRYLATLQSPNLPKAERDRLVAEQLPELVCAFADNEGLMFWDDAYVKVEGNTGSALLRITSQRYAALGDTVTAYLLHNRSQGIAYSDSRWVSDYYRGIDFLDRNISYGVLDTATAILEGEYFGKPLYTRFGPEQRVLPDALRDLSGTIALRKGHLARAEAYFAAVSPYFYQLNYEFHRILLTSPFVTPNIDSDPFPGKLAVVCRLRELDERARNGDLSACLDLAEAWHNMSYGGKSWMMISYSYAWSGGGPCHWPRWGNGKDNAGIPLAQLYYELAFQNGRAKEYLDCVLADAEDPELLARARYLGGCMDLSAERNPLWAALWEGDTICGEGYATATADDRLRLFVRKSAGTRFLRRVRASCNYIAKL